MEEPLACRLLVEVLVRRTRILVGLVMVMALVWTAAPALAIPPEISRFAADNYDNPDFWEDGCGEGADLTGVFKVKGSETLFFDTDGTPIQLVVHIHFDGVLTRLDTGNSIKDPGRIRLEIDLATGVETVSGLDYNMVYPGVGPVFQNVGRVVFDPAEGLVFSAGPNDFEGGKDPLEEVCKALA